MAANEALPANPADVCIVGAGIAGLNALAVAARYLGRDQRVVLIDRRHRVGGMWVDTYSYVQLHQPHGLFTAGDIPWTMGEDRSYLASKDEVLDHFEHCVRVARESVQVETLLGWEFESEEVVDGVVRVACRSPEGAQRVIQAKRLVKAYGVGVVPNDPLKVSSDRVRSVSPDTCDMRSGDIAASNDPVWVIGGGKTGMDTAHALITRKPGREVNLVAGSGTFFSSRDRFFPTGARRWWGGTRGDLVFIDLARQFDGTNEQDVMRSFREKYGVWLTPGTGNFFFGLLSEAERDTIAGGLNDVLMDHFVDVVDRNGSTELLLRSGGKRTVRPGTWVVNCTGYLLLRDTPYEPYVSGGGSVMTVTARSLPFLLSSFSSYFLSNLLFLDKLGEIPLYAVDIEGLRAKSRDAHACAAVAATIYNLSLMIEAAPLKVLARNGLDLDRWYPLPRQLAGVTRFVLTHRRYREQLRRALDTTRERFDVRCGPVV